MDLIVFTLPNPSRSPFSRPCLCALTLAQLGHPLERKVPDANTHLNCQVSVKPIYKSRKLVRVHGLSSADTPVRSQSFNPESFLFTTVFRGLAAVLLT